MTTTDKAPIRSWETDFDHGHPDYAERAPEIWDELRATCPIAHSERYGGTWLPVRHDDVSVIAKDTDHFTSRGVLVSDFRPAKDIPGGFAPPITSDPPFHKVARQFLLPAFAPKAIAELEDSTRALCHDLIDDLIDDIEATGASVVDASAQYTQHIPVRVIARMLGIPADDGDKFRGFIHRILETPGVSFHVDYEDTLDAYIGRMIAARLENPTDDLITHMMNSDIDGQPLSEQHVRGTVALLILAGIDTTWSAIGASLWHLAQHPEHRRRWIEEPEIRPFAVEEFLRFYAPVTMARLVAQDIEMRGCPMMAGDWVLLPFPAANRDPEAFDRANEFVIDRQVNRHGAFGLGIHRCVGSNLARLELSTAIEVWMERFPNFELADAAGVRWSTGQIRGPRELPVDVGPAAGLSSPARS
jgi:cytochrome P450